jgi:hypothetical protein
MSRRIQGWASANSARHHANVTPEERAAANQPVQRPIVQTTDADGGVLMVVRPADLEVLRAHWARTEPLVGDP